MFVVVPSVVPSVVLLIVLFVMLRVVVLVPVLVVVSSVSVMAVLAPVVPGPVDYWAVAFSGDLRIDGAGAAARRGRVAGRGAQSSPVRGAGLV
ncbi:hypothetical protein DY245_01120 [Streptomyces inhibens]|uniref:Uncharacterized protein n=1 Tax=Streptomyces inhibens TaxID=2293571 RepID=A0A371QBL7_STRIH|nr:hypothetical protein DY245_01120 [Streptomyces inhibens]